jgi:antitoxin component YwqK of YwqJK toxin-antitoxin module
MKYLITILLVVLCEIGFGQIGSSDSSSIRKPSRNIDIQYSGKDVASPCVKQKMGRTYHESIGETYHRYIVAKGWYSLNPISGCINSMYDKIPFTDIAIVGGNYFIKYKRGHLCNGKIRDTYVKKLYGKSDKYTIVAHCKKGLLNGKLSTFLNGNIIVQGQLKNGKTIGLWKYYYKDTLSKTYYFEEDNDFPTNIISYQRDTSKLEYIKNYKNEQPYTQIIFHPNGDTLSTLNLIDSIEMIYDYVEFYPNGSIKETGRKQLKNQWAKLKKVGYFSYNNIGSWKYYDKNKKQIRIKMN